VDTPFDLVAQRAYVFERHSDGIREVPVEILAAREHRADVTAAHRHDHVGPLDVSVGEALRLAPGEVDADLTHRVHHGGVELRTRPRAGGACLAPEALVERLRHLRASGVPDADEERAPHAPSAPRRASTASGTRR